MAEFLHHAPCESCGSSDGLAVYSDGSAYCFACDTPIKNFDGELEKNTKKRTKTMSNLLDGEFKALNKRKISEATCKMFNYTVGKDKDGKSVQIANYYNAERERVAQKLRYPNKEFVAIGDMKSALLYGQHLWRGNGKRLVITEGEIDALSVSEAFHNKWDVVSLQNGSSGAARSIKKSYEFVNSYEEIVIWFDADEPGLKATEKILDLLDVGKVKVVTPPADCKDANDVLVKYGKKKVAECVFNAKPYRPDGIIAGEDISLEDLLTEDEFNTYDIPYPKLNTMLRGIRKQELTMLTAGSGVGKSTFATELGFHLMMEHGLKVGHIALEESVKKSALNYMAIDMNVPKGDLFINRSLVPKDKFEESYKKVIASGRFYTYDHFGSLDSKNLLNKLKYMAVALGVDFIILDHISIVVSGQSSSEGERKDIDILMTELRSLIEQTGVGVIAITHLKQNEGTPHEEGGRVRLNELRGSGSLKQLSDNIIAVERNQQGSNPNEARLRLLKNRLFGDTGKADKLVYVPETGRLLPIPDDDTDEDFKDETRENHKEELDF